LVNSKITKTDVAYMRTQVASLINSDSKSILELALSSTDHRVRAAGCIVARKYGLEYLEDLISSVGNDHELVRQAGRESLLVLSTSFKGAKPVDFGPMFGEKSNLATCASQNMWKAWFAENQAKKAMAYSKKGSVK
jgi:hypothetical protein